MIRSVLLVDDDPTVRMVGELALSSVGGLETHVVASGDAAVAAALRVRPDVILLDVVMPGMDGPETLARLREDANLRSIPVVFCTARSGGAEAEALVALGAVGVITKPFDPMRLADEVRRVVATTEKIA